MATTNRGTALLVMDVQPNILGRLENGDAFLVSVREAVHHAHKQQIPVIFVVVGFRPGLPEISAHNRSFGTLKTTSGTAMVDPKPAIEPEGTDVVVTKRRVSAFAGSDLEVLLRGMEIRHLVLAGISTSGVVLSTTREAADKDFQLTILSDLCADFDAEVHRVLMEKVFPRQAEVLTSAEWFEQIAD